MKPIISIIIPTYNRAHIIKETLDSVLHQTFENWECLVIDDGSNDNTKEVIQVYLQDKRFKYFERPEEREKGACTCRNIGIEKSSGEYIQFLDSDDILGLNKFEVQLNKLKKASPLSLATCKWGGLKPQWEHPRIYEGLASYFSTKNPVALLDHFAKWFTYLPVHAYLVPRALIEKSGKWNNTLKINQDGEFFTRVILNSSEIIFCPKMYVLYRTGSGNRISTQRNTKIGISNYIKSWNLIDDAIFKKLRIRNHFQVRQAKAALFSSLKEKHSELIAENESFLLQRTPDLLYKILKFQSRVRDKLFVKQIPLKN
ncbi:glycosyltransferase family 2 protein [Salegentibacter sp. F188]|uniref:Glycosyltransferase family 2 protein n=1 Tax=Autumnicola patrickiae TaxID=3075591 RepID=A0ABU3DX74_9FLAO|nr:glycosyltransferase family 2 protein [Salegentibacter sp. F188]MDT0688316.1 glycosyltransferase family 2 protein [Salegentibacter sp. F188]